MSCRFRFASLTSAALLVAFSVAQGPQQRPATQRPNKAQEGVKYHSPAVTGSPAKLRMDAWAHRQRMMEQSVFGGIKWRSVGPEYQGGRVVDIEAPSSDPNTMIVAFATGGLYRTEDNGITWESLFDNQSAYAIGDTAVSRDGKTIWVGTGENNSQRTSYSGTGMFKSSDAGKTWQHAGLDETHRIGRVLINPKNENTVYVAAVGALYSQNPNRGVYKTSDGGRTWQWVLKINEYTGVIDLVMDPRNPDVLYAAAWERDRRAWNFREGGPGTAIYKTTDGGKTWSKLTNGLPPQGDLGRIGLAIAASRPDTIYALIDNQGDDLSDYDERQPTGVLTIRRYLLLNEDEFVKVDERALRTFVNNYFPRNTRVEDIVQQVKDKKLTMAQLNELMMQRNRNVFDPQLVDSVLYRSDDAGKTWRKANPGRLGEHLGYYCGRIVVNPRDENDLVMMGTFLLRSRDGGRSWTEIAEDNHVDHHAYWFDPTNAKRQFNGNDGGIYLSGDDGRSWRHLNNLAVGQFTTIAVDMKTPYNIYGGLQDNGTMKGPSTYRLGSQGQQFGGNRWSTIGGGDGSAIAVDPRDGGDIVFIASQFGSHSGINQKTNERWSARAPGRQGEPPLRYNWISPIIISSHHPDIVYLGSQKLHRSFNSGRQYTDISADMSKNRENGDVPFSTMKDISESPLRFGLIYVGYDDGTVKMTPDGGFQWIDIPTPQPNKWVSRIVASKYDLGTVYCAQSGYREDDFNAYLWKSTDYGKTWKSIVGNLPAETINVVREDPSKRGVLYVGTDMGVYVSFNDGESWESLHGGLMTTPVHDLVVHPRDNELVIASHARSVWVLPLRWVHEVTPELRSTEMKLLPLDDLRRGRDWGYRYRDDWDTADPEVPRVPLTLWTNVAGKGVVRLKDKDGKVVKEMPFDAVRGYNFISFDLKIAPGKPYTTTPTQGRTAEEILRDPRLAERAQYVEPGDYTFEIEVGGKKTTGTWKLNPPL